MAISILVVHERIGNWGRQLRGRLSDRSVRIVETRSVDDMERVLKSAVCPIILIDLGRSVRSALSDLDRALRVAPDSLTLVVDPNRHEGVALIARELGATHVFSGPVTPIEVIDVMVRWLSLTQERSRSSLRTTSLTDPPKIEECSWLTSDFQASSLGQRSSGD